METQLVNGATEPKKTVKKVSKLKAKDPKEATPTKPKILVFGKPGVGKTFTSLDFPKVYYIDTEGGASREQYTDKLKKSGGAYLGLEEGSLDANTVLEQVQALATEEHGYRTIVLDSLSKLFNKIVADEAEKLGEKDAFGASKKPAIAWMRRLLNWLDRVDMNVVLICHQKEEWAGSGQNRESIGATFDAWDKLEYELDLTLHIQKRGQSRVAVPRKSRLVGFPENEAFPWDFVEFANRYGKEVVTREVKPIELATPEQVAEVAALLEKIKVSEAEISKWFSAAKVESWAEMDSEKIGKAINYLKGKLA